MKVLSLFNRMRKKPQVRKIDYREDLLLRQGREQFKALIKKGLGIPVTLL